MTAAIIAQAVQGLSPCSTRAMEDTSWFEITTVWGDEPEDGGETATGSAEAPMSKASSQSSLAKPRGGG